MSPNLMKYLVLLYNFFYLNYCFCFFIKIKLQIPNTSPLNRKNYSEKNISDLCISYHVYVTDQEHNELKILR